MERVLHFTTAEQGDPARGHIYMLTPPPVIHILLGFAEFSYSRTKFQSYAHITYTYIYIYTYIGQSPLGSKGHLKGI